MLRHLKRAGAEGAGAAKDDDFLHGCVRTCRKYKYMMGALNSKLSSKSRMPPMPGNNFPESFTPASRLKSDSIRSPTTAQTLKITPIIIAWVKVIPANLSRKKCAKRTLASVETAMAP